MGRHGKIERAAREIGLSRRSISAYLKSHPELAESVAVARRQAKKIEHHAPRMLTRAGIAGELLGDGPGELDASTIDERGRRNLLELLSRHANDGESRGCSKALHILSEIQFARELLAIKAEARRAEQDSTAGDQRPAVILVPQVAPPKPTIDAVLVDPQS
jgi:hypothetical protein